MKFYVLIYFFNRPMFPLFIRLPERILDLKGPYLQPTPTYIKARQNYLKNTSQK